MMNIYFSFEYLVSYADEMFQSVHEVDRMFRDSPGDLISEMVDI